MPRHRLRAARRNARVTAATRALLTSLVVVADTSRMVARIESAIGILRSAWAASATETGTSHGIATSGWLISGSRIVATGWRLAIVLARIGRRAVDRATVTGRARWTEAAVRSSWLYRWLTADPEPEVIVIDLRETFSVGPVIAALDRLLAVLLPARHRSTVVGAAEVVHQAVTIAPVRVASLVVGVAVLANLAIALAVGQPTRVGVTARVILLGLAALGTRISLSWDELVQTRAVRLLVAALEPPEPPEER